eukprot:725430-Rhodomonas_salina.1
MATGCVCWRGKTAVCECEFWRRAMAAHNVYNGGAYFVQCRRMTGTMAAGDRRRLQGPSSRWTRASRAPPRAPKPHGAIPTGPTDGSETARSVSRARGGVTDGSELAWCNTVFFLLFFPSFLGEIEGTWGRSKVQAVRGWFLV